MNKTPLNTEARARQEEYSSEALPISQFEGQTIVVSAIRTVTRKDGTEVVSAKTHKPLQVLVLANGTEVWPTPNVLGQLDLNDPAGTYKVRGFNTDFGNRGFGLVEVTEPQP